MIYWMDFALDEVLGPVLVTEGLGGFRTGEVGQASVEDDANAATGALGSALIQETRQGQQPARMVGQSSLEVVGIGMEAEREDWSSIRTGGRG